jgi:hypothetical protein
MNGHFGLPADGNGCPRGPDWPTKPGNGSLGICACPIRKRVDRDARTLRCPAEASSDASLSPARGAMAEVVEDHVRTHLVDAEKHPGALNAEAAGQLLDIVRAYLK